jgi:hypothetical protein
VNEAWEALIHHRFTTEADHKALTAVGMDIG